MDDRIERGENLFERLQENIRAFSDALRNEQQQYLRFEEYAEHAASTISINDIIASKQFAERKLQELSTQSATLRAVIQPGLAEVAAKHPDQIPSTKEGDALRQQVSNGITTISRLLGNYRDWVTRLAKVIPANDN